MYWRKELALVWEVLEVLEVWEQGGSCSPFHPLLPLPPLLSDLAKVLCPSLLPLHHPLRALSWDLQAQKILPLFPHFSES